MNNTELIKLISRDTELAIEDVKIVLNTFSKYVCVGLMKGEEVPIGRLGKLKLKLRKSRIVHNFKTNTRYESKPFMKPQFIASKSVMFFVDKLNKRLKLQYEEPNDNSGV